MQTAAAAPGPVAQTATAAARQPPSATIRFIRKTITIGQRHASILLQGSNGPCPLVAIFNTLSLRGTTLIGFNEKCQTVSDAELVQILANVLMERIASKANTANDANASHQVDEVLRMLPLMKNGLDVNVKFTLGCSSFERTSELQVFDLFNLPLVHGWLVDPQDEATASAFGGMSYNQAIEKVILMNELLAMQQQAEKQAAAESAAAVEQKPAAAEVVATTETAANASAPPSAEVDSLANEVANVEIADKGESTQTAESSAAAAPAAPQVLTSLDQVKQPQDLLRLSSDLKDEILRNGNLIQDFLDSNPTQLTYYGLSELHNAVAENRIAIFFRNSHFSVIVKKNGHLLQLCTDEGYLHEPDLVWERLADVNGETNDFFTGQFQPYRPKASNTAKLQENYQQQAAQKQKQAHDADMELAMRLQKEEEEAYRREMQQQQQYPSQQQPYYQTQPSGQYNPYASQPSQQQQYQSSQQQQQRIPTIRERREMEDSRRATGHSHKSNDRYKSQSDKLRELHEERLNRNTGMQDQMYEMQQAQQQQQSYDYDYNRRKKRHSGDGCLVM